ncbi:MAG: hypothetical protein AB8B72_07245 [Crocinitomicaceae bacterium]
MYNGLLHAHSGLRWIALFFIIAAIVVSFTSKNKPYAASEKKMALFALISVHVQLLIGFVLYFISPKITFPEGFMKNATLRFLHMEHLVGMILGIALITIGYSIAKRKTEAADKRKAIKRFFIIGFLIILVMIPWPFRGMGNGWF